MYSFRRNKFDGRILAYSKTYKHHSREQQLFQGLKHLWQLYIKQWADNCFKTLSNLVL